MTGFASLSWKEWQAKTKSATQRQRKECLSWMDELWTNTHIKDWPKEWEHLQKTVRQETLFDALNISEAEHKKMAMPEQGFVVRSKYPIEWTYLSWVEATVFSDENKKAMLWLQLMNQWVDWKRISYIPKTSLLKDRGWTVVGYEYSIWLTYAMLNNWNTDEIQTAYEFAEKCGWSMKEIPEETWPRLWLLNSMSDSHQFNGAWLLEKVEQNVNEQLYKKFVEIKNESIQHILGLPENVHKNCSPFLSIVRWSISNSAGIGNSLMFWAKRVHLLSNEELETALIFFNKHVSKNKYNLSSNIINGWDCLVSSIERTKLNNKITPIEHNSSITVL